MYRSRVKRRRAWRREVAREGGREGWREEEGVCWGTVEE